MRPEKKAELKAWAVSLGLHGVVFVLLAFSGVFLLVKPVQEAEPVDVALLDNDGAAGGSLVGGATLASAPDSVAPPLDVVLPTHNLPPIQESYTQEPQKQQEYRQQHQVQASVSTTTVAGSAAGENKFAANRQGSGVGTASSNGQAGEGMGSGAGHAASVGNGNGTGAENMQAGTERVAARCIYRPSPAYPESLRQQGVEGSVQVLILVAEDDSIEAVEVVKSSGYPDMDAAAVNAAYGCHFQMNGHRGRYTTTYGFQLIDEDDW